MKFVSAILICFLLFSVGLWSQQIDKEYDQLLKSYYSDFPTWTINQVKSLKPGKSVHLVDTREWNEYKVSHLKGARYLGYDKPNWDAIKNYKKSDTIIVYCSIGARSQQMGEELKKRGFTNVYNMYGGIFLWANNGYPMVDMGGKRTDRIHGYSADWGKWVTNAKTCYDQ